MQRGTTTMKSIKTKITLTFSVLCVILILTSSFVSYYVSSGAIENESTAKVQYASEKYSELINGWLDGQAKIVSEAALSIENEDTYVESDTLKYLEKNLKANPNITDFYIGTADKHMVDGSGWVPEAGYDPTTRPWYKSAMAKDGLIYTSPYLDKATNKMVISIAIPVTRNGIKIGVLSADVNLGKLTDIINKAKPVSNSYAYLIDSDNNIMIHPNKAFQPTEDGSKNLKSVFNGNYMPIVAASAKEQALNFKDYDGTQKYFISSKVAVTNWIIGFAIPTSEFQKPLNLLITSLVIVLVVCLLISIVAAFFFSNRISKPILEVTKLVNKIKGLDLTDTKVSKGLSTSKDEVGVIYNAVTDLRDMLRGMVTGLKESSNNVLEYSGSVSESVKETVESIEAVNNTVAELAKGAGDQAQDAQESVEHLNEFTDEINIVVETAAEVKKYSVTAEEMNKEGINSTKTLSKKLLENTEASRKVSESITELSSKSEQIGQIVSSIESIASQTNLLALNAAIEAARAGESGKGFAVVADEVRKLAEQTSNATKQISEVIQDIQSEINSAKANMENAEKTSNEANLSMTDAERSFQTIGDSVVEMNSRLERLVNKITEVNAGKEDVASGIQGISAISEEFAASTQEVSASMEEQTSAIEIIAENAENLRTITNELNDIVSKFKL